MAVWEDLNRRWDPGGEYLWDEYDPESLLDTPEKARYTANYRLFGRLVVYRALRAAGRDVQGRDPFEFQDQVSEVMSRLRERFPRVFGEGVRSAVQIEVEPLKLAPGDPALGAPDSPP
jgi:hypothetical protein